MPVDEEWKYPAASMVRRKPMILPNGKQEMAAGGLAGQKLFCALDSGAGRSYLPVIP